MNLEDLLNYKTLPKKDDLTDEDLARLFIKYKGLLKKIERDEAFWAATNENIKRAYSKLDELVEKRTIELKMVNEQLQQELTERKKVEEELKKTLSELKRSNEELQQFAYVASHDLQQPLRMVASYTQLLAKRYKDKLDKDANEFIKYAVDGANNMKTLIEDLLEYSRIQTRGNPFEVINFEEVLKDVLFSFHETIKEKDAEITHDYLPNILADKTQLIQVFQNLIDNALKFRSKDPVRIHISAKKNKKNWQFSVKDNGIGIDPEYFDRIFIIFQRLHRKSEYPGTGIGLALCKRIIERHNGKIWVESKVGKGSTFHFTIPIKKNNYMKKEEI